MLQTSNTTGGTMEVGHASGWSIDTEFDATGEVTYRWRVWHGPASEGNATGDPLEAHRAVYEAYERLRDKVA